MDEDDDDCLGNSTEEENFNKEIIKNSKIQIVEVCSEQKENVFSVFKFRNASAAKNATRQTAT